MKLISLQESIVQTLSAGMILDLTAGYNFHPCKRGKSLLHIFGNIRITGHGAAVLSKRERGLQFASVL